MAKALEHWDGDPIRGPNAALLARRKALGFTQMELAELAGVSPRFIHELENGKSTVRLDRMLAVATALGLELEWRLRPPTHSWRKASKAIAYRHK